MQYKNEKKLDDKFNPAEIEQRAIRFWQEDNTYAFDKEASRENTFVVDTPPPTVSGSLHIGHIFSYTQADVIVRYQRMMGKTAFYPIGWDDNGLPTERRVQNYFNITYLYYNPNIFPEEEYELRKDEFVKLGVNVVSAEYNHQDFLNVVKGKEQENQDEER